MERIKAAVHSAEDSISGEIVPVFVEKSGYYTIARYRGALLASAITFLAVIVVDRFVPALAVYDPLFIFFTVLLGGILGAVVTQFVPLLEKALVSQAHKDRSTRQRAENAFLEEEVFNTRHRTGIMIFVSFFEQEVIVMADRGISKVVEQKEWDKLVQGIISKVRSGQVTDGIIEAVGRCGAILLEKGFVKTPDDVNELRDDLRIQ